MMENLSGFPDVVGWTGGRLLRVLESPACYSLCGYTYSCTDTRTHMYARARRPQLPGASRAMVRGGVCVPVGDRSAVTTQQFFIVPLLLPCSRAGMLSCIQHRALDMHSRITGVLLHPHHASPHSPL